MKTYTPFQALKTYEKKNIQMFSKEICKCKKCNTTSLVVQTHCKFRGQKIMDAPSSEVQLCVQFLLYLDQ